MEIDVHKGHPGDHLVGDLLGEVIEDELFVVRVEPKARRKPGFDASEGHEVDMEFEFEKIGEGMEEESGLSVLGFGGCRRSAWQPCLMRVFIEKEGSEKGPRDR